MKSQTCSIVASLTLLAAAALIAASRPAEAVQDPRPSAIIVGGVGPRPAPPADPDQPVAGHLGEYYYEASTDRIMLYEEILYESGDAETRISPARSQYMPQSPPSATASPYSTSPAPCALVVQSAAIRGNAAAGTFDCSSSVLCLKGNSNDPCSGLDYTTRIDLLHADGSYTLVATHTDSTGPITCNVVVTPYSLGAVTDHGTYRGTWSARNSVTGATLWNLSTQITYQ